jgi:hypothetical protein
MSPHKETLSFSNKLGFFPSQELYTMLEECSACFPICIGQRHFFLQTPKSLFISVCDFTSNIARRVVIT